jgi:predicted acylesterase/phospholipase RssA
VTGAVWEIGALRALEELLDRSVLDLDLYVGVSGGAFVSALLAAGVSPREMYDEIVASRPPGRVVPPLFRLGLRDVLARSRQAPGVLFRALVEALAGGEGSLSDAALSLFELLPAGLLDSSGVRHSVAEILRRRGVADEFAALARPLRVVAVDLDRGEAVAFGARGRRGVPVSRAVQASTALPGLYRPVRIGGRDYVDGGVKKTAHVNLAIGEGARLVLCINPMVPLRNDGAHRPLPGPLSGRGVAYVLDQALRIMLHGRMQYGLERYHAEHPEVDILLLEPDPEDLRMFRYNILRYGARRIIAELGYRATLQAFRRRRPAYTRMLARHGVGVRDPRAIPDSPAVSVADRSSLARTLEASLARLDASLGGKR